MAGVRVEPALEFVRAKGTPRDKALLKVLLGEPLTDGDLEAVRVNQNPDGGFRVPELKTNESVVGRTAEMVMYLAALGAADFGCAQAAADFLIERQRPDGTWDEAPALNAASPPPYFRPGSNDVIGWVTSAGILALTAMGLTLEFHGALAWIEQHRIHTRGATLFRVEEILAWEAFQRHAGLEHNGTQRLRHDVEAMMGNEWEVFELNFALLGAKAAGVGPSDAAVARFGEGLAKRQRAEGGFGSGPEPNGFETVLALCALDHAGLAKLPRAHGAADHEADPAKSDHGI